MLIQLLILFFPWEIRRRVLIFLYGFEIAPSAWIGKSIILARKLSMKPYSRIHHFVLCKKIDLLALEEDSGIATGCFITGFSSKHLKYFKHRKERKCELVLGKSAGITNRHFIDCNGGVYIGEFSTIAGLRTQVLTHSIDVYQNRQDVKPVNIGRYCFIGTGCIILPGTGLPDFCVLGAGSVLTKAFTTQYMLYAGNPAAPRKKLDLNAIKYFHRDKHFVE